MVEASGIDLNGDGVLDHIEATMAEAVSIDLDGDGIPDEVVVAFGEIDSDDGVDEDD